MSRVPTGLISRSAPVVAPEKPRLFKMPTTLASRAESDKANIGPTRTAVHPSHQGHSHYSKPKADLEKYDSGLDEITQRWQTVADLTPVACTDTVLGPMQHEYLIHSKEPKLTRVPSVEQPLVESKMETSMDISVDSAIEPSTNSSSIQSCITREERSAVESKLLQTVHYLFVEDEDGER